MWPLIDGGALADPESLDFPAVATGSRRVQVEPRAVRMRTTLDAVDVGSGQQIEQIRGQARLQLHCGAFAADSAGSQ